MAQYLPAFRPGEVVTFDVTTAVVGGRYVQLGTADRSAAPAGAASTTVLGVAGHDAGVGDKVAVEVNKVIHLVPCAAAVGNVELGIQQDGVAVPGATATETVATAGTEYVNLSFAPAVRVRCCGNARLTVVVAGTTEPTITNLAIGVVRV